MGFQNFACLPSASMIASWKPPELPTTPARDKIRERLERIISNTCLCVHGSMSVFVWSMSGSLYVWVFAVGLCLFTRVCVCLFFFLSSTCHVCVCMFVSFFHMCVCTNMPSLLVLVSHPQRTSVALESTSKRKVKRLAEDVRDLATGFFHDNNAWRRDHPMSARASKGKSSHGLSIADTRYLHALSRSRPRCLFYLDCATVHLLCRFQFVF